MACKDEFPVLAQVLQTVLTADPEDPLTVGVPAVRLLGERLAGDTLWDVPHAGQTAVLHWPKALSCTSTHGQTDRDSMLHSILGLLAIQVMVSVNRKCMCCTFLLLLGISQLSRCTHLRRARFTCVNTNKNRKVFQCAVGQQTC